MKKDRARRWRCKIDNLVVFFVFLYIKVHTSLALFFFIMVGYDGLACLFEL